MGRIKNKKQIKNGFSLIEIIITIAIFNIIILAVVATFATAVLARKNARLEQRNLESARTAMESMAKTIRMSSYLRVNEGNNWIRMHNTSQNKCVGYTFSSSKLYTASFTPASPEDCLESDGYGGKYQTLIDSADGRFEVTPTNSDPVEGDVVIGKATILLILGDEHIQTTVSFRDYENIIQ